MSGVCSMKSCRIDSLRALLTDASSDHAYMYICTHFDLRSAWCDMRRRNAVHVTTCLQTTSSGVSKHSTSLHRGIPSDHI